MKKLFLKYLPQIASIMGFEVDAKEPITPSEESKEKLDGIVGKEGFAEAFVKYYNDEYINAKEATLQEFDALKQELQALGIDPAPEAEEEEDADPVAEMPKTDEKSVTTALQALIKDVRSLMKTNAQLAADNEKLKDLPEEDKPEAVIQLNPKQPTVKHSKTHLFASGQDYDSLDRPWNKRLVDAINTNARPTGATVWDKINIDKLNSDLGAYARRNSNEIMDLLMDGYDIPEHWSVISNVQDQYVFAQIVSGEITQAFKKAWLPKNNQKFVPIINKIYDKQIDGFWSASELKSIEKSWLNMFFNEGSTPYKDSFARYLIENLLKRARKEDKISIFKGVYSDPELQPEKAGSFLNAMSGFLKLVNANRNVNYKAHNLPTITPSNAYDVINDWCKVKLPIDIRNTPLKLGLGNDVHRWYVDGRETAKGTVVDYQKVTGHVEDMPNIEFVKHPQLEGTGFIYITTEDNIGLMVDRPGEESLITIEKFERTIRFFADWKLGVFFKAFGARVDDQAITYEDQIFFSNNQPLLTDVYVPVAANDATPSVSEHHALKIGSNNTAATDITDFDDVTAGQYIYLYGDSDTNVSTIKNNTNIILASGADFVLQKGDMLTLVESNGKLLEYSSSKASEASTEDKVTLAADATTADASAGTWFVTQANTGATELTNITNAVVDEVYTLEGGSDTDSTTVASSGNFLLSAAFTASDGAYLKVRYNGNKFVEVDRG